MAGTLDDGLLLLCQVKTLSRQGEMPVERLAKGKRLYYSERPVGYNRQYAAARCGVKVDRLVRTWLYKPALQGQWYAVIGGEQYRVDMITSLTGDDGLRYMDITLSKLEELYEVEACGNDKVDKRDTP